MGNPASQPHPIQPPNHPTPQPSSLLIEKPVRNLTFRSVQIARSIPFFPLLTRPDEPGILVVPWPYATLLCGRIAHVIVQREAFGEDPAMSVVEVDYKHIVLDEAGVPILQDTTTKVIELVLEKMAYGWSAEELHFQHPHLTLGQIHSALAYYWDHQEELDRDIERRLRRADRIQHEIRSAPQSPNPHLAEGRTP
jgi:uncharacterized protein (DUF433 family)